jgi:hypothetical protein
MPCLALIVVLLTIPDPQLERVLRELLELQGLLLLVELLVCYLDHLVEVGFLVKVVVVADVAELPVDLVLVLLQLLVVLAELVMEQKVL